MKKAGFSIIEIIVVIVVIAILMMIAVVGYSWMRRDALDAKLEVTAQNVIKKIQATYVRNKGQGFPVEIYDKSVINTLNNRPRDDRSDKVKIKEAFMLNEFGDDDIAICSYANAGDHYDLRQPSYIEDGPDDCMQESMRSKVHIYVDFCEAIASYGVPSDAGYVCISVARWSYAEGAYIASLVGSDNTIEVYKYDNHETRERDYLDFTRSQ